MGTNSVRRYIIKIRPRETVVFDLRGIEALESHSIYDRVRDEMQKRLARLNKEK